MPADPILSGTAQPAIEEVLYGDIGTGSGFNSYFKNLVSRYMRINSVASPTVTLGSLLDSTSTQLTLEAIMARKIGSEYVLGVSNAAKPLLFAAPTAASVGVASGTALAANTARAGAVFVNTSGNTISLASDGNAAVLNSGITLNANGGTWVMDSQTFTQGAITAIAGGAASNLAVQEITFT